MSSKEIEALVVKTFRILRIKIPRGKKSLKVMLEVLKKVASGPVMSQSDISVHDKIRELITAVELNKSPKDVEKIVNELASETEYRDYWD